MHTKFSPALIFLFFWSFSICSCIVTPGAPVSTNSISSDGKIGFRFETPVPEFKSASSAEYYDYSNKLYGPYFTQRFQILNNDPFFPIEITGFYASYQYTDKTKAPEIKYIPNQDFDLLKKIFPASQEQNSLILFSGTAASSDFVVFGFSDAASIQELKARKTQQLNIIITLEGYTLQDNTNGSPRTSSFQSTFSFPAKIPASLLSTGN